MSITLPTSQPFDENQRRFLNEREWNRHSGQISVIWENGQRGFRFGLAFDMDLDSSFLRPGNGTESLYDLLVRGDDAMRKELSSTLLALQLKNLGEHLGARRFLHGEVRWGEDILFVK